MQMPEHDLRFVAQRIPRDVRELLEQHAGRLYLGGGFIRAVIAGETPNDIDLFGDDPEWLKNVAHALVSVRPGAKIHTTHNAITVITPDRLPVQFITRWTFDTPEKLVDSFDFTIVQCVVFRKRGHKNPWAGIVSERFYNDLASRRLVYTSPVREEEAGGSMLRVIKYVKRGYSIQVDSLGKVIARLAISAPRGEEHQVAFAISGLLREVDPLLVIDGFEVVDDHAPLDGGEP